MKKLTLFIIRKSRYFGTRIFNSTLFMLLGLVITLSPLLYLQTIDANTLIGLGVCFLCFGIPFGFFFGLKKLTPALREKKALSSGEFSITTDRVKSTRMLTHGVERDKGTYDCQIEFEKYSKETGKYYTISREMFYKTNDGDEFYLVYLGDIKNTISIFPRKQYELAEELKKYCNE